MDFLKFFFINLPILFIYGLGYYLLKKQNHLSWIQTLYKPVTLLKVLFVWIVFGFLAQLDYTQQLGCIVGHESTFSSWNILFSSISIGLITFGYFIPNRKISRLILLGELFFWLGKLYTIKGGYTVGIGAVPSLFVFTYDIIALSLRLILIKHKWSLKWNSLWLYFPVSFMLTLKIHAFLVPIYQLDKKEELNQEIIQERMNVIQGKWYGILETEIQITESIPLDSLIIQTDSFFVQHQKTILIKDSININIDSNTLKIYNINEFKEVNYKIEFYDLSYANLSPLQYNYAYDTLNSLNTSTEHVGFPYTKELIYVYNIDSIALLIEYNQPIVLTRKQILQLE